MGMEKSESFKYNIPIHCALDGRPLHINMDVTVLDMLVRSLGHISMNSVINATDIMDEGNVHP